MEIEQIDEPDRTCAVHRRTITMDEIRDFYDQAYSRVVAAASTVGVTAGRSTSPTR